MLNHALALASQGWPVFPLDGKIAHVKWAAAQTTDTNQIRQWWQQWPTANVGVATGEASGLLILDVDGPIGDASLLELTSKHGNLPTTRAVKTGRGSHYYFCYPVGGTLGNTAGKLGPGLDTRGQGGYVVAPGSVHTSGAVYHWIDKSAPIAPLPDWLLGLLTKQPEPKVQPQTLPIDRRLRRFIDSALFEECSNIAKAGQGGRNHAQ